MRALLGVVAEEKGTGWLGGERIPRPEAAEIHRVVDNRNLAGRHAGPDDSLLAVFIDGHVTEYAREAWRSVDGIERVMTHIHYSDLGKMDQRLQGRNRMMPMHDVRCVGEVSERIQHHDAAISQ